MEAVTVNRKHMEIALLICNVVLLAMLVGWWNRRRRVQAALERYRIGD